MVLAIQTAPRTQPTLSRTLASLEKAGFDRWEGPKYIVADGYDPGPQRGWRVEGSAERNGSSRTLMRLLSLAGPELPLLYLQDDIVLARNALDYIRTVDLEELAFISWFGVHQYVLSPAVTLAVPSKNWITTQAVTISPAAIRKALDSGLVENWREHGCDKLLCAAVEGQPFAVHHPNLVQHVGVGISAIRDDWSARTSPTFIGEDADALNL